MLACALLVSGALAATPCASTSLLSSVPGGVRAVLRGVTAQVACDRRPHVAGVTAGLRN